MVSLAEYRKRRAEERNAADRMAVTLYMEQVDKLTRAFMSHGATEAQAEKLAIDTIADGLDRLAQRRAANS